MGPTIFMAIIATALLWLGYGTGKKEQKQPANLIWPVVLVWVTMLPAILFGIDNSTEGCWLAGAICVWMVGILVGLILADDADCGCPKK